MEGKVTEAGKQGRVQAVLVNRRSRAASAFGNSAQVNAELGIQSHVVVDGL
jgi:hypothetical protein